MISARAVICTLILATALPAFAEPKAQDAPLPDAVGRNNGENYRDLLLARCIARAYEADSRAEQDARASASALADLTDYDTNHAAQPIDELLNRYLSRNYQNALPGYKDVRLDLLKCIDLYHSKELAAQVQHLVPKANQPSAAAQQATSAKK